MKARKAAKVQSVHYGYAMSYKPTKATTKEAAKVLSVRYGYAMSYTPTNGDSRSRPSPWPRRRPPRLADPAVSDNTNYEYYGSPSGSPAAGHPVFMFDNNTN